MGEFLKVHRHCMSALEIAAQQASEGGTGFCPLTAGLHAFSPSWVMRHTLLCPLAATAAARTKATNITNLLYASIFLSAQSSSTLLVLQCGMVMVLRGLYRGLVSGLEVKYMDIRGYNPRSEVAFC